MALSNGTRFAAYNKDMRHASVVVCLAFKHADEKVLLLSHKLDPELYGSDWFMEEARGFLGGGDDHTLDILVESDLEANHPVLDLVREHRQQVSVKRVPNEEQRRYKYNYMVVDDKGYRFESDREEPRAVVFFNDDAEDHRSFVNTLKSNFDVLASRSEPIAV